MKLSSLLDSRLIEINDQTDSIEKAVEILTEKICRNLNFRISQDEIINSVKERELIRETLLPEGIAIPHCRIDKFEDIAIAIFLPKRKIVENGKTVKIIFLIITSKESSTIYLNTLSSIAKLSINKKLWDRLIGAQSPSEIISLLDESGIMIKKELNVSDIMNRCIISVTPETTIKELVDVFSINHISYIPVIDSENELVGEVEINDVIGYGIPDYINMVGSLKFLSTLEPFEEMLKNEEKILVKNIMRKPTLEIKTETSIVELAFRLIKMKKCYSPVIKNGRITGIVGLEDIVNKVLRA